VIFSRRSIIFIFFKSSPSRQQEQNKDNSQYRP
jgi:hypothetical protein